MKKIKHTIRDTLIWLVSVTGKVKSYQREVKKHGPLVRVVCFHDVVDREWFEKVIEMLIKKYHVLTPEDFHNKNFSSDKINILITFDDGYQSWIDNVLPVFKKFSLKGLFFVNSGLLNIINGTEEAKTFAKKNLRITPKQILDWEGARELFYSGNTIGGHSIHHVDLSQLSKEEVLSEIFKDKKDIETHLGNNVMDFAYPFGRKEHFNNSIRAEVSRVGYTHIYTAESGFVTKDMTEIPRTLVEKNQNLKSLKRWIEGGYDVFNTIKKRKNHEGSRESL